MYSLKSMFSQVLTGTLINYRVAVPVRMIPPALTSFFHSSLQCTLVFMQTPHKRRYVIKIAPSTGKCVKECTGDKTLTVSPCWPIR